MLWLWHRLGAIAPIGPLVWEPPYAMGVAIKETKRPQKREIILYQFPFIYFLISSTNMIKDVTKRELLYIFVGNVKYCSYYLKIAFPYKIKHTVIYVQ